MCVPVYVYVSIPHLLSRVPTEKGQKELKWVGARSRILPSGAMVRNVEYDGHPKHGQFLNLELVDVSLIRNSVLADVTKDLEMRPSWIPCGLALNPVTVSCETQRMRLRQLRHKER